MDLASLFKKQNDHTATSVVHLARRGLWLAMPGEAGEAAVLRKAFVEAQCRLRTQAGSHAHLRAAQEQAQRVLNEFVTQQGWTLEVDWR